MIGDDHTDILVLEFRYDVLDILDSDRVDSGKRFVKKNELRVDGKRAGYLATATLSS